MASRDRRADDNSGRRSGGMSSAPMPACPPSSTHHAIRVAPPCTPWSGSTSRVSSPRPRECATARGVPGSRKTSFAVSALRLLGRGLRAISVHGLHDRAARGRYRCRDAIPLTADPVRRRICATGRCTIALGPRGALQFPPRLRSRTATNARFVSAARRSFASRTSIREAWRESTS